jgi:hypothetical protein
VVTDILEDPAAVYAIRYKDTSEIEYLDEMGIEVVHNGASLAEAFPKSGNPNADPDDPNEYDFTAIDEALSAVVAADRKTVFHLWDLNPILTKDGKKTGCPKDQAQYEKLVRNVARHLTQGWPAGGCDGHLWGEYIYGWKHWNEPNLRSFWSGTMEEYLQTYATWARALKSVDPNFALLAPEIATAGGYFDDRIEAWMGTFLAYCDANGVKVDLLSAHKYSPIPFLHRRLAEVMADLVRDYTDLSNLYGMPRLANNEWNWLFPNADNGNVPQPECDTAWAAANYLSTLINYIRGKMRYTNPFTGLMPMSNETMFIDDEGNKKPSYYSYVAISQIKNAPIILDCSGTDVFGFATLASKSPDNSTVLVYVSNFNVKRYLADVYPRSHNPRLQEMRWNEYNDVKEYANDGQDQVEYTGYHLTVTNLPWGDRPFRYERYLLDDTHNLVPVESKTISGGASFSTTEDMPWPSVHLIKLISHTCYLPLVMKGYQQLK